MCSTCYDVGWASAGEACLASGATSPASLSTVKNSWSTKHASRLENTGADHHTFFPVSRRLQIQTISQHISNIWRNKCGMYPRMCSDRCTVAQVSHVHTMQPLHLKSSCHSRGYPSHMFHMFRERDAGHPRMRQKRHLQQHQCTNSQKKNNK